MKRKLPAYNPAKFEKKWQKKWAGSKLYKSKESAAKKKYYVLDMFPYPSGEGLHVGHPKGYIATDIVSRMKRMRGMNVLHPMGFDAFGLPAENYAIKTKTDPQISVTKNIARYKRQLELLGFDYDWSREVNTTDPDYYKWTQWIFLQIYKKGLAYESLEPINWCPSCKTGLANEDVEDGRCERCGTVVEKKPMRHWVLRITDYADRLLNDLDIQLLPNGDFYGTTPDGDPYVVHMNDLGPGKVRKDMPFVPRETISAFVEHWSEDKFIVLKWKKVDWLTPITGGIEKGQTPEEAARAEIIEETGFKNIELVKKAEKRMHSTFFHVPKNENRIGHFTCFHFKLKDGARGDVTGDEQSKHEVTWVPRNAVRETITAQAQKIAWALVMGETIGEGARPMLDWPESIKELERNWIGRSEGALIKFAIKNSADSIEVFTTRPDTLFGVTYVVLAPEHELVKKLLAVSKNKSEIEAYITQVQSISEKDRTDASKEKTGIEIVGVKAINPANKEEVPVWIADYVLADYGTGAVMAVPAHDERDFEFARKFKLRIKQVVIPEFGIKRKNEEFRDGTCAFVFDPQSQKYAVTIDEKGFCRLCSGGIDPGEDNKKSMMREVTEESGLYNFKYVEPIVEANAHFHNMLKKVNRFAHTTCYLVILASKDLKPVKLEAHEKFTLKWVSAIELRENWAKFNAEKDIDHWLWLMNQAVGRAIKLGHDKTSDGSIFKESPYIGAGKIVNSGKFNGKDSQAIIREISEFAGGKCVTKYKLRDWVFSRQRYWGEPIPLIHCKICGVVPVPEKDLPVRLPKVKSYEPTGTGESPLANITKWVNVKCPKCGDPAKRETNTMPQWAGSCWYYLRYEDPKNKKKLVDPKKEKYWSPVDLYVGGAEHATRHLIYARFWHKFLYDIGAVSDIEPFKRLQNVGLIMGEDGKKMSKRLGNVVNPDDIIATYGADTMRIYEMFMGPFDQQIAWNTSSMVGSRRFIERVWKMSEKIGSKSSGRSEPSRILHKTIKKVTEDIEKLRLNTAISSLMICANELEKDEAVKRSDYEAFLKLLAPFAPHATEEIWAMLGNKKSIHISVWPQHDPALITEETATIIVQINGKVRGSFISPKDVDKLTMESTAKALPEAQKWLKDKAIKRVVVVQGKLVNIVV